ncbi:MAG: hypothetical protein SOT90_04625, partial [Muribaculaceae bacterium]|nr:hypothetical protein [Muribaculaceae bacterium]
NSVLAVVASSPVRVTATASRSHNIKCYLKVVSGIISWCRFFIPKPTTAAPQPPTATHKAAPQPPARRAHPSTPSTPIMPQN